MNTIPMNKRICSITERQLTVLQLSWEGLSSKEIAQRLGITDHAVDTHKLRVRQKWGCPNTVAAFRIGLERGYLQV